MKSEIDELGKIQIPVEIRKYLEIEKNDCMDIEVMGGSIVLTPVIPCCMICGSVEYLVEKGKHIFCCSCWAEVTETASLPG